MCLMLYLGTNGNLPLRADPDLAVEEVESAREAVRQWFSLPIVRFIGANTGCSCGFPHVVAAEPIEYWDGMFDPGDRRDANLRSVRALLTIIREHVAASGSVELYPVWDGNEHLAPKGTIEMSADWLNPETFLFTEQFLYRVKAEPSDRRAPLSAERKNVGPTGRISEGVE